MIWWKVVLIAWGAFLFGFILAGILAAGKRADEVQDAIRQGLKLGGKKS